MKRIVAWVCSNCRYRIKPDQLSPTLYCPNCRVTPVKGWEGVVRKERA